MNIKAVPVAAMAVCAVMMAAFPFVLTEAALWWLEGAGVVLLVLLVFLYRRLVVPMQALEKGVRLLTAQDFSCRLASVGQRDADNIAATFNRMMDTLRNERLRILEQNQFLDMLIDTSPTGIVILNYDGTVRSANPSSRAFLECDSPEGLRIEELPGDLSSRAAALRHGETATFRLGDTSIYRVSRLSFLDNGFRRPFLMFESLSEEVRRAEKAAYGKVIRMMAHEVRNTVAGSMSLIDAIAATTSDPDTTEALQSCSERWDSLTAFVTAYADMVKLPAPERRPLDLNVLIRSMLPFLESLVSGNDVVMTTDLCEGPTPVCADSVQMELVMVNIVKNAVESINSAARGGNVSISTAPDEKRRIFRLTITDDGPGISAEAAENIFTPFFSTKSGGRGIGLTLISEILRNHAFPFSLSTDSEGPRLTRFTIDFPVSAGILY